MMTSTEIVQLKLKAIQEEAYLMDLQEIAVALSMLADEAWKKVELEVQPSIRIDP